MRRAGRFEKGAKLPLDFTHRIRYNKSRSKAMRRCVGMADEGDSKSLVLITRVGSTPTTGIKKKLPQPVWGSFLFYLRRVSGSNSTALLCRASDQPCGLSLSARETPTTGIASSSKSKDFGLFFFFCSVSYTLVFSGKILTIAFAEDTLLEKSRCVWI